MEKKKSSSSLRVGRFRSSSADAVGGGGCGGVIPMPWTWSSRKNYHESSYMYVRGYGPLVGMHSLRGSSPRSMSVS